jgi:hypothetical protein
MFLVCSASHVHTMHTMHTMHSEDPKLRGHADHIKVASAGIPKLDSTQRELKKWVDYGALLPRQKTKQK